MIQIAAKAGRLLIARPALALCIVLLGGMLVYRELYHRSEREGLQAAADQAAADMESYEIAQERRYLFMQQELDRLDQERAEQLRMQRVERAALTELARMNEMAHELVRARLARIDELKSEYDSLNQPVPDAVVRLFESTNDPHDHSTRVHSGTGPR